MDGRAREIYKGINGKRELARGRNKGKKKEGLRKELKSFRWAVGDVMRGNTQAKEEKLNK